MKKLRKRLESARAGGWSVHRRKPRRQLCILRMSRWLALLLATQGAWEVTFLRPQANCRTAFCTLQRFSEAPYKSGSKTVVKQRRFEKKPTTKTIPQNDTPTIPPQWGRMLNVGGGPLDTKALPLQLRGDTHLGMACERTAMLESKDCNARNCQAASQPCSHKPAALG